MKSLLLLSLTILLAACSTTSSNKTTENSKVQEALSLEEIAEKSQSTKTILQEEDLSVSAQLNNTSRNNGKEIKNTKISTKSTKKNVTK